MQSTLSEGLLHCFFSLVRNPASMRSGCTAAIRAECADVASATVSGSAAVEDSSGGLSIMSWFLIALWAPFLVACANHNDKFLLSRYLKEKSIGAIVILSSLFSGVAIAIVLFIQPDVYDVRLVQGFALVATGMLSVLASVCYLYALDSDEASFVTPFYQTVPIFAYFLGYFILGETITLVQGVGSFVVIAGALALSFEFGPLGIRFKRNVSALMLAASFLSAINGVIFKLIALDKGFLVALFWGFVGQVMAGLTVLVCVPTYRRDVLGLFRRQRAAVVGLIALSRMLLSVSEAVTLYATLLAPVALVLLVNSFQPLFVFTFGVVLTVFLPRVAKESLGRMKILQKGAGIGLMLVGGYLISR
jgi:drug/metabolite transporter (DMT)-like permease